MAIRVFLVLWCVFLCVSNAGHSDCAERLIPYLLPEDHPAKEILDQIFSVEGVLESSETLAAAGFTGTVPRHTRLVVARHPALPGWLFKIYPETQLYDHWTPERIVDRFYRRAAGARVLRKEIEAWHTGRFTVPRKWVYRLPLPDERIGIVLIEDDLPLCSHQETLSAWQTVMSPRHLIELLHLVTLIQLDDGCAENIPYLTDGRFAFVDLERSFWPTPNYLPIGEALSEPMRQSWYQLVNWKSP